MPSVGCKILLWSFAMVWMFSYHAVESAKVKKTCGYSSVYMHHRFKIVRGRISERGMWPWQIGIYVNYKGDSLFLCGGALISRLWVLTAAHCFYDNRGNFYGNASMYLIKAGDHNLSIYETSQQEIAPEIILVHHEFENSSFVNGDIALIKLRRKVLLNRFVKTVCLPAKDEENVAIPHAKGIVAGWGITRAITHLESQTVTPEEISKVLRHAALEIQSDRLCLMKSMLTYNSTMTFCAGDGKGGSDTCKGDSGGAFVRQIRRKRAFKQWVVIGVVSWGIGCAQRDQFGYYTRVYPFIGWIKKTMKASCRKGFGRDNQDNCVDLDECEIGNDYCPRINGECVNTHGSYYCKCKTGFQLHESRYRSYDRIRRRWYHIKTCRDVDECEIGNGDCPRNNGICVNTHGSYYCRCKTGFQLHESRYRSYDRIRHRWYHIKTCRGLDCILVGSLVWGLWSQKDNSSNYFRARITRIEDNHIEFTLEVNNAMSRRYSRITPVLIIDKIPDKVSVDERVIAVHKSNKPEWYRTGSVKSTGTANNGKFQALVKFDNGYERLAELNQIRSVKRPRVCIDNI